MTSSGKEQIISEAYRLGFDAVRFARADTSLDEDFSRYEAFVRDGKHGDMAWLARSAEARRRLDTSLVLDNAKTIICLAHRYARAAEDEARDPEILQAVARYARASDYHNFLRKKLRKLAAFVRRLETIASQVHARPLCDREPILERAWAARAGLGFIGKNGMLVVPGIGSLVLLGEVVTTLVLEPDAPVAEKCGTCTRCLDACPTSAFERPFVLDPRKCIAYLTIEHRGTIAESLRAPMGTHLFGCDDCQVACPHNASVRRGQKVQSALDPRFVPNRSWSDVTLTDLLALGGEHLATLCQGSPLGRLGRVGLARNAAIAIGNRAHDRDVPRLEETSRTHDSELVREAAAWAAARARLARKLVP
ncbi:MAG: tRNA epoxyqueuosine(34) reductase QueG [Polyangiaceae bacterium]|nr:tRNA epoxyqueuosine(34) reductase QueG [Polyangiaceae bacterium]